MISVEQTNPDIVENDVKAVAERNTFVVSFVESRQLSLFTANSAQILSFIQIRLAHLHLS